MPKTKGAGDTTRRKPRLSAYLVARERYESSPDGTYSLLVLRVPNVLGVWLHQEARRQGITASAVLRDLLRDKEIESRIL